MNRANQPALEDFLRWAEDPVTKAIFEMLVKQVQSRKDEWAAGDFLHEGQFATAISNARAIGNCEALEGILSLEYEQLIGALSDGK